MNINVKKRSGKLEPINLDKIHKVITWASEGLDVSVSEVEMKAQIMFYEGIETEDIHLTIIKSAADLISVEFPDYQYLAARLSVFNIRKKAYKSYEVPTLFDQVTKMVSLGKYDAEILEKYDLLEFEQLNDMIDHGRDLNFAYAGIKQIEGKYLVQNRVTGELFESPQIVYIMIAATLFANYEKDIRLEYVKDFYDAVSTFKISLPTPIMSGVRTPTRQFSSCVLIDCGDNLNSINATASAIVKYVSQRAGIGINAGAIRALGSEIRGGEAMHTGCIPFYKYFQTAVKSCSQGGVRGGAATVFYPIWHLEVESLLVLKNNRGIDSNRVRHMDYGVQFSRLFYERLLNDGNITLFSPSDVPGLYDNFYQDNAEFERLYKMYEADESIRKKSIPAVELFSLYAQERASTGRVYLQNVDHTNSHSPFNSEVAPIKQSNLCLEIALPTKPLQNVDDPNGEVALCTLSAINLGLLESLNELENLTDLLVRGLDELLDYQDYPLISAYNSTMARRTLGIGFIGYAHYLAKNNVKYSDGSANNLTHRLFEAFQYYLMDASNTLAIEKGPCPKWNETKMSYGILPVDTYKKEVDEFHTEELHMDWSCLRENILKYGMRNSTVSALMPSETSSQISNATNGIEPPRGFISVKASKDGILKQVVPDFKELKESYELLWNMPDNNGYLELVGIMQKFVDQAISANTNYDPSKFPDGKVSMTQILSDLVKSYKLGLKTMYYHNTRDDAQEDEPEDDGCESGACKI